MPGVQVKAVERWLEDGWSPWRIGYGVVGLVLAGVGVIGYATQPHHPGAVWWLLAAVAVVAVWALLEMVRWRIRHNRLQTELRARTGELDDARQALDENPTAVPGVGLILEIEYSVTNHDPVPHQLTSRLEAGALYFSPTADPDSEHVRFIQTYGAISQRRERDRLPRRVRPGETVHGVYVTEFAWNPNPSRRLPDYKLLISDGRREYEARPIGADRDGTPR